MHALTWRLDVSTNKAKTAAVAIEWSTPGQARVVDVRHPLPAADIAPLIGGLGEVADPAGRAAAH